MKGRVKQGVETRGRTVCDNEKGVERKLEVRISNNNKKIEACVILVSVDEGKEGK